MKNFEKLEDLQPSGYACETLINGDVALCIEYIAFLYSWNLILCAYHELNLIEKNCPERFYHVINKVSHACLSNQKTTK
jgi:uncharacterized protein involved in tolerance to divalent cations